VPALARRADFAQKQAFQRDQEPQVALSNLNGEIRDGRHHMQVRVYYEDTDFSDWTLS
jgi:hypothetical protein